MMEIDILNQLFFSTDIYSYFGPLALIVIGFFLIQKERMTFIFLVLVESLVAYQYFTLINTNGWFIWHAFLMAFGIVVSLGIALNKS